MSVIFSWTEIPVLLFNENYGGSEEEVEGQIRLCCRLFLRYFSRVLNLGCGKAQMFPKDTMFSKNTLSPGIRAMDSYAGNMASGFLQLS